MKKKVFVIIPAHNEEKNIGRVIKEVKRYCKNIVVVDDGSKDNTSKIAEKEGIYVLKHLVNLGKGAAVITGSEFAIKKGADILIYIDGDLQHDPREIPRFLKALEDVDIVFGVREFNKKMPFILRFGNLVISKMIGLLYHIKIKDSQCGYRALTKDAYEKVKWKSDDYSMESEMIANVGKNKLKFKEIVIKTRYNDKYKGTTVLSGIKIIFDLIKWKFIK